MDVESIISDLEIASNHWGNFGPNVTPREIVNEGVIQYAHGFSSGSTVLSILLSHKLLKKPKPGSYRADLTQKGKSYARALYSRRADTIPDPLADPRVKALVAAARRASHATTNDGITGRIYTDEAVALQRALAAFKDTGE